MRAPQEDPVLNGDRMHLARPHADEGEALRFVLLVRDLEAPLSTPGAPERQDRGMQEPLPGLWADGIAEQLLVSAPLQLIVAAGLLVGPAGGKIVHRAQVVIDDRAVPQRGTHGPISRLSQRREQAVEVVSIDDEAVTRIH